MSCREGRCKQRPRGSNTAPESFGVPGTAQPIPFHPFPCPRLPQALPSLGTARAATASQHSKINKFMIELMLQNGWFFSTAGHSCCAVLGRVKRGLPPLPLPPVPISSPSLPCQACTQRFTGTGTAGPAGKVQSRSRRMALALTGSEWWLFW